MLITEEEMVESGRAGDCGAVGASDGALILNADDWGRDRTTTGAILDCFEHSAMSSTSAMVFMEDSARAAAIARERGIDTGLHLNVDTPFTGKGCNTTLLEHQRRIAEFVRHPLARPIFHPGLRRSFEYLVSAQVEEYERLYGETPERVDGHHHMHLCANVLMARLLPQAKVLRPHFTRESGEKAVRNRLFRAYSQWMLAKRYKTVDYLFSLTPLETERIARIVSLSRHSVVEIETHPVDAAEFEFLTGPGLAGVLGGLDIASRHTTRN